MSILIIGGSGFVGSRLIYEAGESNCINLDKNKSLFYPEITTIGDVRKPEEILIDKNIKTIVLLAAEHKDNVSPLQLYYSITFGLCQRMLYLIIANYQLISLESVSFEFSDNSLMFH